VPEIGTKNQLQKSVSSVMQTWLRLFEARRQHACDWNDNSWLVAGYCLFSFHFML